MSGAHRITAAELAPLLPPRERNTHKGDYGYVALLGGCMEYSGAAKLANLSQSALRAGCGVATLAVPATLAGAVAPYLLESTLSPAPDCGDGHMVFDADYMTALTAGKRAVAVGMGWGRSEENKRILNWLLSHYSGSLLIDADGLWALAGSEPVRALSAASCRVILTPHHGEFARLTGLSLPQIESDRLNAARDFAKRTGTVTLLKGFETVVTDGETVLTVDRGCPGMATAGSGDVLSGVITGLLSYLPPDVRTVALGAYLCGLAGEYAARDVGEISMLASDTVSHLAEAVRTVQKEGEPC